ncbi:replication initiator protein [Microviridae sp.]|nr:replication initiator protein [Microviridae sp.]
MNEDYMIPCGKCQGCLADKRRDWATRIYHESRLHERNCFITLTYETPPPSLHIDHVQTFLKRLRKNIKLRYFLCGEYGEKTHRPHYHAVLFGTDLRGGEYDIDGRMYGSPLLDTTWGHGFASVGTLTMSSACYVAGYVQKKLDDPDTFTTMSRRPPIGYHWALHNQEMLQRREKVVIEGRELPIPKAYLEWYNCSKARPGRVDLDSVKANRRATVTYFTPQEMRNKEKNHIARNALKSGEKI